MKKCNQCNQIKSFNDFYQNKKSKDGFENKCKKCRDTDKQLYYSLNKDKWKNCGKYISNDKNRERGRLQRAKRRALIKTSSDNTVNINTTNRLLEKQKNKCNYCKLDITDRNIRHLDHIIPLSKGGIHSIKNIQWLCCGCNLHKSDKIL